MNYTTVSKCLVISVSQEISGERSSEIKTYTLCDSESSIPTSAEL